MILYFLIGSILSSFYLRSDVLGDFEGLLVRTGTVNSELQNPSKSLKTLNLR